MISGDERLAARKIILEDAEHDFTFQAVSKLKSRNLTTWQRRGSTADLCPFFTDRHMCVRMSRSQRNVQHPYIYIYIDINI